MADKNIPSGAFVNGKQKERTPLPRYNDLSQSGHWLRAFGRLSYAFGEIFVRRTIVCRPSNDCLSGGKRLFDKRQTKTTYRTVRFCSCCAKIQHLRAKCKYFTHNFLQPALVHLVEGVEFAAVDVEDCGNVVIGIEDGDDNL